MPVYAKPGESAQVIAKRSPGAEYKLMNGPSPDGQSIALDDGTWKAPPNTDHEKKLAGVPFEGVNCSATKEDMWGLSSVESFVRAGNSIPFHFDNGETLVITPDNIDAFQAVWTPFRAGFFSA